jgi:hypothetical protein
LLEKSRVEVREVLLHLGVEHRPFGLQVVARDRLDLVGDRIDERSGDVGLRPLEDRLHRAVGEPLHDERRGVPAAAVDHEQTLAFAIEPHRPRSHGVLEGHGVEGGVRLALDEEGRLRAVGIHLRDQSDLHRVVEGHAGEAGILEQQGALAGGGVHQMDVVVLRIAVVEADRERVGEVATDVGDGGANPVEGREVDLVAGGEIHRVGPPVLVAAAVLQIDQVRRVGHPEVLPDAAVGVLGDRLRRREVPHRRHPDVEDALDRRQPRDLRAVGADLHPRPIGIAEERRPGNQRHRVGAVRGRRRTTHEECPDEHRGERARERGRRTHRGISGSRGRHRNSAQIAEPRGRGIGKRTFMVASEE